MTVEKMQTSAEWWNETKNDTVKLHYWLQRQCYGEFEAFKRLKSLSNQFNNEIIDKIAGQEFMHHKWLKEYMLKHNIPELPKHETRYWNEVNLKFENLEQAAAVAYHAESMRLERIRLIAKDETHLDLAQIFQKILIDEEFHAEAFKFISDDDEIAIAKIDHEAGLQALGLVI